MLLILCLLLPIGGVAYAVVVPTPTERFTEFYLLTESEDGELVADGYPHEFTAGEPRSVHVGIANNEHRSTNYTVVVELQDVRVANNSTTVRRDREVDRYRVQLAHNETWVRQTQIAPTMEGDRLRWVFLLYRGPPPEDPTLAHCRFVSPLPNDLVSPTRYRLSSEIAGFCVKRK